MKLALARSLDFLAALAVCATLATVVSATSCSSGCAALPAGGVGQDADALARAIEGAVNKAAWDQTGAVRFGFRGTRSFVWDRQRSFFYAKAGDTEVWLDLWDQGGTAKQAGQDVDDATRSKLLADAWGWFCNDTFWLNPLAKLFDPGTTRELVLLDPGKPPALKVSYASGGTTPGDAYLWIVDDKNKPVAVRMWVSVLPVKGIEFSWDGWTSLATGAVVATEHRAAGVVEVAIDAPAGAATLQALEPGADRFAALVARRAGR